MDVLPLLVGCFQQFPMESVKNQPWLSIFIKQKRYTADAQRQEPCTLFVTIFMLEKHQKPLSTVTISPVLSKKN